VIYLLKQKIYKLENFNKKKKKGGKKSNQKAYPHWTGGLSNSAYK